MKKLDCWILSLLLFLVPSVFAGETREHVRVVVEHWPPWEIANDEKKEVVTDGVAIELVDELMRRVKVPVEYVTVPWKRALSEVRLGKSDLIPMIAKDTAREEYMVFTTEIYADPILLAYSVENFEKFEWNNWEDLADYTFQLVRGYTYGNAWDEAVKKYNYQISMSTSDIQSIRMLAGGRIDLIPLFFVAGTQLLSENDLTKKIRFTSKPIKETTFYFGVSKRSFLAKRLPEINSHIQEMKRDGSFQKILKDLYRR